MAPLDSDYIRPASPSSSAFLWREDTTEKAEEEDHTDLEREDDDEDFYDPENVSNELKR